MIFASFMERGLSRVVTVIVQHASAELTQQNILEWLSLTACGNAEKQTEPGS